MTGKLAVPVFDGLAVLEHGDRMAESVRAINHLCRQAGSVPDPATIYRLVMCMETAVRRIPQALSQLDARLATLADRPGVVGLTGGEDSPLAAPQAAEHADALADALESAAQYLGCLSLAPRQWDPPGRDS